MFLWSLPQQTLICNKTFVGACTQAKKKKKKKWRNMVYERVGLLAVSVIQNTSIPFLEAYWHGTSILGMISTAGGTPLQFWICPLTGFEPRSPMLETCVETDTNNADLHVTLLVNNVNEYTYSLKLPRNIVHRLYNYIPWYWKSLLHILTCLERF